MQQTEKMSNLFYPPGGLLVWLFVFMELLVFGIGLAVLFSVRSSEPEMFSLSQDKMSQGFATINTVVLLTSGYLLALSQKLYGRREFRLSARFIVFSALLGVVFLLLKSMEYFEKISLGITTGVNSFFDLYWFLTLFHAFHVFLGVFILLFFSWQVKGNKEMLPDFNLDTGATYWHMCDLIWIMIFPALYFL